MTKSKADAANSQLKSALKQLRKMGLYDPKRPRAAPTKYAKTLVSKYSRLGLLGDKPKATVVKIPTAYAKEIATEYRTKRVKGGAVAIVPNRTGVKTTYSKKENAIVQRIGAYKMRRYSDSKIFIRGGWPSDLKKGERMAIPQGNGWKILKNQDEVNREMMKYDPFEKNVNFWQYPYVVTRA